MCVPVNVLQESVKHYEELKGLSNMRSQKRKQNKTDWDAKLYKDYDWPQLIKSDRQFGETNCQITRKIHRTSQNYMQTPLQRWKVRMYQTSLLRRKTGLRSSP